MTFQRIILWPGTQILMVSVLVFFLLPQGAQLFSFSGSLFQHGEMWRLFTFPFAHLNLTHLLDNILALAVVSFLALELELTSGYFAAIFMGVSILLAISVLLFSPGMIIVGASGGIFALLGYISLKGNEFIPSHVFVPIVASPLIIKLVISLFQGNFISELFSAQSLLHLVGFIYGLLIFGIVFYYHRPAPKKILEVD